MLKKRFFLFILLHCLLTNGQQENLYTQFMYNPSIINPGYTGSRLGTTVFMQGKQQWMGYEGAPKSSNLNFQHYLENKSLGIGLDLNSDVIGPSIQKSISLNFSYHLQLSENEFLGLGIQGTLTNLNLDLSLLNILDSNDPFFSNSITGRINPNIGVGFYYYNENSYLGISSPRFFNSFYYDTFEAQNFNVRVENVPIYLMTGHVYEINESLKLKPALFIYKTPSFPVRANYSVSMKWNNMISLGASYSKSTSWSTLAGLNLNDNLFIGYSYDISNGRLDFGYKSHEVVLRYEFRSMFNKVWSDRFF